MKFLDRFKSLFGSGDETSSSSPSTSEVRPVNQLLGKIGKTLTPLRTSGYIDLEGRRMEVTSSKGYVPKGRLVRISGKKMGVVSGGAGVAESFTCRDRHYALYAITAYPFR